MSSYYYWAARGVDERPVRADRIRKSVGAENTFPADLFAYEAARDALREIVDKVWDYCEGSGIRGRTVTLKVKFANFGSSRAAALVRCRSGRVASSNSWAAPCSSLSFLSPEAFDSWASPCLRSRRKRLNSLNSACPVEAAIRRRGYSVVRRERPLR